MTTQELAHLANRLRLDVVEMVYQAGDGHPGPCMSIAEAITVLYFDQMKLRPQEPHWPHRDRFILSKGHACPILYAALARRGYFSMAHLPQLRSLEGMLQGHPDMQKTPGIDYVSGSLGNGIAIGAGMALGLRMLKQPSRVYVMVGDGEMEEGVIWEAAMAAAHHHLASLTVLGDLNGCQSGGHVEKISALSPVEDKWRSFGWHVLAVNGHDTGQLRQAIEEAQRVRDRPTFIGMKTIKGKNISYMENNNAWHKRTPTNEELAVARRELEALMA